MEGGCFPCYWALSLCQIYMIFKSTQFDKVTICCHNDSWGHLDASSHDMALPLLLEEVVYLPHYRLPCVRQNKLKMLFLYESYSYLRERNVAHLMVWLIFSLSPSLSLYYIHKCMYYVAICVSLYICMFFVWFFLVLLYVCLLCQWCSWFCIIFL